jgi:hypothetical protein
MLTRADRAAGSRVPPVYVRVVAPDQTVLQRATDDGWDEVCEAPCDGYVPAFGSYRVVIRNDLASAGFTLPGPPGTAVTLKVEDDARVWTRNSVWLDAWRRSYQQRAAGAAGGGMMMLMMHR